MAEKMGLIQLREWTLGGISNIKIKKKKKKVKKKKVWPLMV